MPLKLDTLRPYQSLLLTQLSGAKPETGLVLKIMSDIRHIATDGRVNVQIKTESTPHKSGDLQIAGIQYSVTKRAAWTIDEDIQDLENHLILVFRRDHLFALLLTEASLRTMVITRLGKSEYNGLKEVVPLDTSLLNAAFVTGPTRTLWLSGIHGPTSVKADAKSLSGSNLRFALDPVSDQSYHSTAARSDVSLGIGKPRPVGVSPGKSSVWLGGSSNWSACTNAVDAVLKHVSTVDTKSAEPLPFLALPSSDLKGLDSAYEVGLLHPSLLDPSSTLPAEKLQEYEAYSERIQFEIKGSNGITTSVLVRDQGSELGEMVLKLVPGTKDQISVDIQSVGQSKGLEDVTAAIKNEHSLRIRFESGSTLSGQHIYRTQFRDYPFEDYLWHDFKGIDICREKPAGKFDPMKVGHENSLFCWTVHHWPIGQIDGGWLACDDGAMEIADFIHLSSDTLTLIHAKGSGRSEPNRQLSVTDYEVVTSQALKGLRWLDQAHVNSQLEAGLSKKVAKAVWKNRQPSTRDQFLKALKKLGPNFKRRVVILQPRITDRHVAIAKKQVGELKGARFRQLMMLLNSVRVSCHGLGADFVVVGQQVSVTAKVKGT